MKDLKILEWNINQRSNGNSKLKDFIIEEVSKREIAIIVEYKEDKVFTTGVNHGKNEVLIAIKKMMTILQVLLMF